jgi:hypothetical protein
VTALARLWPVGVLAAAGAVATLDIDAHPIDVPYFVQASQHLLSADWAHTFADPKLQAGPLQLLFFGLVDRTASVLGVSSTAALAYAVEVLAAGLLMLAVWRLLGPGARWRAALTGGVSLAAVALGVPHAAFDGGHAAQVLIPACWLLAAVDARDGRAARAGILLGLSSGLETWGVLGLPVLLLSDEVRELLRGVLAQALTTFVLYAPFALAGDFRMFEFRWEVAEGSPASLVLDPGTPFSWPMRLVQGAAALAVGASLAYTLRRFRQSLWTVPLAVVGIRLLLEPRLNGWYFLAFETLALAGAASLLAGDLVGDALARRVGPRLGRGARSTAG